MLSRRSDFAPAGDPWVELRERRAGRGGPLLDLVSANPTAVGLEWDARELARLLGGPDVARHEPHPMGRPETRRAIACWLADRGRPADADHLLLTASTSESHSLLLRVLCDPGDAIVLVEPGYPLLDVVARLDGVERVAARLRRDERRWSLDVE